MTITIKTDKSVAEFQNEFSAYFPFLKVEFFTRPHPEGAASWSKYMVFNRTKTLGEIGDIQSEADFDFTPDTTVGDFEQTLWTKYALAVQVFRKSMNTFIETTSSDSWTLGKQNSKGEESAHTTTEMVYQQRTNDED